jgi:tetratricopeptide (TPR) repeat protein
MEKLSQDLIKTKSNSYLEEIEDLIVKNASSIETGNLEPFEKISNCLWECFMLLAFKYMENEDIKNHHLISKIIYFSYDKVIKENTINIALAKFHFAKTQKDFYSNFTLSLKLFNESISLLKFLNEENTKLGLTVKFYLGGLYDDMGMYDESLEILSEVKNEQIKIFTEENILVARTYNFMGIAEDNRGNLKPAREFYQKSYKIFKNLSYGLETVDSVKVLNNLAGIYYRWEDFTTSLKLYIIVLEVYENKFGMMNNYVGITFNNIGNCHEMMGDNKKASFCLSKALEIFIELFGERHPQSAMCYKNLGDLNMSLCNFRKALEMFLNCIDVFKEKYGEYNDVYLNTLCKIKKLKEKGLDLEINNIKNINNKNNNN